MSGKSTSQFSGSFSQTGFLNWLVWMGACFVLAMGGPTQVSQADEVRDFLDLIGIGPKQLEQFGQNDRISETTPELLTLLMRAPAFPVAKLHQWQRRGTDWGEVVTSPQGAIGQFYLTKGRAQQVTRIELADNLRKQYQFDHFYRVDCELAGERTTAAVLYCRKLPRAWQNEQATTRLNEVFSATALLLRVSNEQARPPALWMVAHRIGWYPDHQQLSPLSDDLLQLAKCGVDISQFDDIRDETRIGKQDREAFYQLLAAVPQFDKSATTASGQSDRKLESLMIDPASQRGLLYSFVGSARRAIKVVVDDDDIRSRYGVDHYYEVTMLVDPGQRIRVVQSDDDGAGTVFNNYPITFCVRELPAEMPTGDLNQRTGRNQRLVPETLDLQE